MAALATEPEPDPWLVADALIAREALGAARAYAAQVPTSDAKALRKVLEGVAGDDPALRGALSRAGAASARGRFDAALRSLPTAPSGRNAILDLRLLDLTATLLLALEREVDALKAFERLESRARGLGWLSLQVEAIHRQMAICENRADWLAMRRQARTLLHAVEAGGDAYLAAMTRADLAGIHSMLADHRSAGELYDRAIRELTQMDAAGAVAYVRCGLATALLLRGDYAGALSNAEWAEETFLQLEDKEHLGLARSTLISILVDLGDYRRTQQLGAALLNMLDASSKAAADALTNSAIADGSLADYAAATTKLERALAIYERTKDDHGAGLVYINRGEYVYERQEQHVSALADFEAAAALAAKDPVLRALSDLKRGDALLALGRPAEARVRFQAGLAGAVALADANLELRSRTGLIESSLAQEGADVPAKEVRAAYRTLRGLTRGLSDERMSLARADEARARLYPAAVRVALRLGDNALLTEFLERGRAAALVQALGGRDTLAGVGLAEDLRRAETRIRDRLVSARLAARTAYLGGDLKRAKGAREAAEAAEGDLENLANRIRREAKAIGGITTPEPVDLEELTKTLGTDTALVYYTLLEGASHAAVVSRVGVTHATLPSRARIREQVRALVLDDTDTSLNEIRKQVEALRKALVKPLSIPKGVTRLLVCPDGELAHLPWPYLFADRRMLAVAVTPSGTTHTMLASETRVRGKGVLGLGDPDYDVERDGHRLAAYLGSRRLTRLEQSGHEVRAITRGGHDRRLLRQEATRANLLRAIGERPRWRAIHLACHGILHRHTPALSALALSPTQGDDGFLRALDVLESSFAADLIVLSACDVGRGQVRQGEGLMGLTRAFLAAGAPRVLVALHPVDDEATRHLMERFYAAWRSGGVSAAAALTKAQAAVRAAKPSWRHPYYWASWVVWGLP